MLVELSSMLDYISGILLPSFCVRFIVQRSPAVLPLCGLNNYLCFFILRAAPYAHLSGTGVCRTHAAAQDILAAAQKVASKDVVRAA